MHIARATSDQDILSCYPVLSQLRPHLTETTFVERIRSMEREGFKLAYLTDTHVHAVAGYRCMDMLATGKVLYIDDLVTDAAHRSRGYGKALLDWLIGEAQREECDYLTLDSALKRIDAHRFYRRNGVVEVGLHFSVPTKEGGQPWKSEIE
jgi:GNAT superfamily N-acetyltransferase